jgi:predicted acetyltransferase
VEEIGVRLGTEDDLDALSAMNKQLIEDEGHENPMGLEQLRSRMEAFIRSDHEAYLFESGGELVGYALVRPADDPVYLRQFFICREHRRKGYGTQAFDALLAALGISGVDVEVLAWNRPGLAFWRSLGFEERSVLMRYSPPSRGPEGLP